MTSSLQPMTLEDTAEYLSHQEHKEILRFVTCGSVDDGKSTLIGRLLLETGAVYEDQLAALQQDSKKHGTTGQVIDPALLVDGLEDERKQGITIDVAYRYFQTPKRKFIIADSPGHEQYTRNMATAASTAQLAIILVDAQKGIMPQTRRHSFITCLLGVPHLVLAVNKLDLVDYEQAVFERISAEFREFIGQLQVERTDCVPLSGLVGDNVARLSENTPWYDGMPLLELLETAPLTENATSDACRFPVQRVTRPDASFRGYAGTVASGSISKDDAITVLPGGQKSRVQSIITFDGEQDTAAAGEAVTLTLADDVDVARGNMIVRDDDMPRVGQDLEATLVWMSEQPLAPGKSYWIKQTTWRATAEIMDVSFRVDINTINRLETSNLQLNEIGHVRLKLNSSLVYDSYQRNRQTGSFILVDRVNHETVAAGLIVAPETNSGPAKHWDVELRSRQLQFATSRIGNDQRIGRYGHPAMTILLTGLSGAGKTTIAFALEERLFESGHHVTVLDGQNLRHGISRDLGFSAQERSENLRRAAEICRLMNDAGMICVAAFVAPEAAIREKARDVIGADRLLHVHLSAPVDVCRDRDISGRYDAAARGEIVNFPGITAPYDEPQDADLVIPTDRWPVVKCVATIEDWLMSQIAQIRRTTTSNG
jgi:bifunctional enzyme CysN/CysC